MDDEQKLMFESVITMGQNALKYSFMANAGATVLLFGLISKAIGGYSGGDLAPSLLAFALGVLFAVIAAGASYLAQYIFGIKTVYGISQICGKDTLLIGYIIHIVTVLLIVASYVQLAGGCYETYVALK